MNTSNNHVSVPSIVNLEVKLNRYGVNIERKKAVGNAVIILDCSGSMAGEKLIQAKIGTQEFIVEANKKRYLTGLIGFGSYAKVLSEVTSDYYKIIDQLDRLAGYGSTNLSHAIRLSYNLFNKTIVNNVLVIVTDGMPNNPEEALYEAKRLKNAGIEIITIGTDDADIDFLRKIASRNDLVIPVQKQYLAEGILTATRLLPD